MTTEPSPAHGTNEGNTEKPATPSAAVTPPPTPSAPAPASNAGPSVWILRTDYAVLGLVLVLSFFLASFVAGNSDLWMHLAIGKRISAGQFEFGVDPYSWATQASEGKSAVHWVHHAWLYSWLVYQIYELGNVGDGLVGLKALLFTLSIALLSRIGWNGPNRWFLIISLLMGALAASGRLLLDPTIFSLFFLSVTMYALHRAGVFKSEKPDPRWLWALPPLFALWANFDAWFILGPMVLGLCWAATGLKRWFPSAQELPGKTLGLAFGVGLAACLINPHHVYVFQLPAELAYLVVTLADPFHLPLPAWWVAGGRTLKELRSLEPGFDGTMSSVVQSYWWDIRYGKNIAGIAFYPLVVLGLLAFGLMAFVKPHKDGPSIQMARFLPWLVVSVMALALYRLIPFFVIVAAPLTALTLGEFLHWQQANSATPAAKRDRGLNLARAVSVPFALLLLYLAWPGWLHGPTDFNSPRRVAWQVRENPSLKKAALTLQALHDAGEGHNVFNGERDLGNVLPWFAPDVRHASDMRHALFAGQTPRLIEMRGALLSEKADAEWRKLFVERKVDQIAMRNVLAQDSIDRLVRFWLATGEWRQRSGDIRVVVFSWAGPGKRWPTGQASFDLNDQAFGVVPLEQRPPAHGAGQVQPLGTMTLYFDGLGPPTAARGEIDFLHLRTDIFSKVAAAPVKPATFVGYFASLAGLQSIPGGGMTMEPALGSMYVSWYLGDRLSAPADFSPPAAPILMIRAARHAVAENPLDFQAHLALMNANDTQRRQEDRWLGTRTLMVAQRRPEEPWLVFEPQQRSPLRDRLRQTQQIVGAYNAVLLQPDSHAHHDRLGKLYLEQHLLDVALDHFQLADKALELEPRPRDVEAGKQFDGYAKNYHSNIANLDKDVKQRLSKWKELSANQTPWLKARLAFEANFLGRPMGLARKALEMLGTVDPAKLEPQEQLPFLRMRYDLLLRIGWVDQVAESLDKKDVKENLPTEMHAEYRLIAAAALGDYQAMDEALTRLEKSYRTGLDLTRTEKDVRHRECAVLYFALGTQPTAGSLPYLMNTVPGIFHINEPYLGAEIIRGKMANNLTLHGIVLLEAGKTTEARERFRTAVTDGEATPYFLERPIARRYMELLDQQKR